jgi:hypothetical protein
VRRPGLWPVALLLLQPPLAVVYLLAVRAGRAAPSFAAVVALGLFPLAAGILGALGLRRAPSGSRAGWAAVVGLALVELGFVVLTAAMIGFAKAWRSG